MANVPPTAPTGRPTAVSPSAHSDRPAKRPSTGASGAYRRLPHEVYPPPPAAKAPDAWSRPWSVLKPKPPHNAVVQKEQSDRSPSTLPMVAQLGLSPAWAELVSLSMMRFGARSLDVGNVVALKGIEAARAMEPQRRLKDVLSHVTLENAALASQVVVELGQQVLKSLPQNYVPHDEGDADDGGADESIDEYEMID